MRVGIDMVHIPSFKEKLSDAGFVRRVFLPSEVNGSPESLAGKFAAKEALFKANNAVRDWLDVEVVSGDDGPQLVVVGMDAGSLCLSIAHEVDYACAVVVVNENRS